MATYRWNITNVANQTKFIVEGETLGPNQPEWGDNPSIVQTDISAQVAAEAAARAQFEQNLVDLKATDFRSLLSLPAMGIKLNLVRDILVYWFKRN